MGDSNSCPLAGNCEVYAREILTQIEGQLKGHSDGGVVGDDAQRSATASNARKPYFMGLSLTS